MHKDKRVRRSKDEKTRRPKDKKTNRRQKGQKTKRQKLHTTKRSDVQTAKRPIGKDFICEVLLFVKLRVHSEAAYDLSLSRTSSDDNHA